MATITDISFLRPSPLRSSSKIARRCKNLSHFKLRCSIAEGPTIPSSKVDGGESSMVDCVVVGGGISGLCVAQALATKHRDVAPNVIVTEARDRVGGNIITVEKDGFLWEEGPNSFQPSDPMLTMAVGSDSSFIVRYNLRLECWTEQVVELYFICPFRVIMNILI